MAPQQQVTGIAGQSYRRGSSTEDSVGGAIPPGTSATNTIYCMDARSGLKRLPDDSVDCVMTSPPYWALRDYGNPPIRWTDGVTCALGLEESLHEYIMHLCEVFDEVRRVLKPTGTCWVNLGDTYHNATKWTRKEESPQTISPGNNRDFSTGRRTNQGLPEKCLAQIPGRFAIAMTKRGWILRNDIVWHKPNHMPSSVKDRFTCSWEHLFFFVKARRYHFDLDVVREPHKSLSQLRAGKLAPPPKRVRRSPLQGQRPPRGGEPGSLHPAGKNPSDYWPMVTERRTAGAVMGRRGVVKVPGGSGWTGHATGGGARTLRELDPRWLSPGGKNPGDSWDVPTRSFRGAHFAVFPEQLCERPIRAGCPDKVCKRCGIPAARKPTGFATGSPSRSRRVAAVLPCKCKKGCLPGLVLDPFVGSGTTAVVAQRFGRRYIGFDVNPDYTRMAKQRLVVDRQATVSDRKK